MLAPELDTKLGWLNTDRALRLDGELRGRVVVLDFWTYCCINCIHILPDLAKLENKYADQPVTFVGVHSAKFANEANRQTIRAATLRYHIHHPVVIDDQMRIWRAYAVRSWPTLVVIDAAGQIVERLAGEGNKEALDQAITRALSKCRSDQTLADGPLQLRRDADVVATTGLAFPGKVLAEPGPGKLFIADSNHNRIIIAELPDDGGRCRVIKVVGSGDVGSADGEANVATFNQPQGMAVGQGNLYVADTENHLIRAVDLSTFVVTTIVGTGQMDNDRAGGAMGTQQGINSPWDLAIDGSTLYVAMAGAHQIWRIDLPVGFARALAGSGRENIVDGPAETAALAQPSGICLLEGNVYFADSEVSAIRGVDLVSEKVFTVLGEGLFSFGDVDGSHPRAKLQHPLGIAPWRGGLVVADTYNHKIKRVDPGGRCAETLYGTGQPGTSLEDGSAPAFFEPGGLSVVGDDVYVADTNNHRIVRIDLTSHRWQELALEGLDDLDGWRAQGNGISKEDLCRSPIQAPPVKIAAGCDIRLTLDIQLPQAVHISPEAPWSVRVRAGARTLAQHTGSSDRLPLEIILAKEAVASAPSASDWEVAVSLAYCTEGDRAACVPGRLSWLVPVEVGEGGEQVTLTGTLLP